MRLFIVMREVPRFGFDLRSAADGLSGVRDQLGKVQARGVIALGLIGEKHTHNGGKDQSHQSNAGE